MKKVLHRASTRGHAYHGWLDTWHTFSFAGYYDPERVHFGALRVLNDDTVAAGEGFGTHPHDNMEIISIPLKGDLEHRDSMGNISVIKRGEIQVMSAGTGITHSEYNKNHDQEVKFLQIWVFPRARNIKPAYSQIKLKKAKMDNALMEIVSPDTDPAPGAAQIHQDAWFHLGNLEKGHSVEYKLRAPDDGVYIFIIKGNVTAEGTSLGPRDGLGISETGHITIKADSDAEVLVMEVPM